MLSTGMDDDYDIQDDEDIQAKMLLAVQKELHNNITQNLN